MKKLTAVLLIALALTLCLTGCGGEKKQNESGNGAGGTAKYSFTLAHHHAVDSITDHLCTNFAKDQWSRGDHDICFRAVRHGAGSG